MAFNGPAFVTQIGERLIQEFRFAKGAGTPGLVGAAKEHPARIQLEQLLPPTVGVGSGIIVDSYGAVSKQQDIVVYEKLCPVFTHNGAAEATFFPVEGVVAAGEVKSSLGSKELTDAFEKCESVKKLIRRCEAIDDGLGLGPVVAFRTYGSTISVAGAPAEQFDQQKKSLDQVFCFLLCERFGMKPDSVLNQLTQRAISHKKLEMPNLIVSLDDGAIFPYKSSSNSIMRAMFEGDGAIFSEGGVCGFSELIRRLRLYVLSGRTVERGHLERYFLPLGEDSPGFTINGRSTF